jgi:propanediol dehydratase large subunit
VAQEPLINREYLDQMLENGPHSLKVKGDEKPYLEVTGSFVFDTAGKSKEEIDEMDLFQGIKIIDRENNEYMLEFNKK